jgi:hypothetical protein
MADVTLSATFADGTIIVTAGFIHIEDWKSADQKMTLTLFPRNNVWQTFVGSLTDTSGSLRNIDIAGVPYRVIGDTDVTMIPSNFKNEAVATSGSNIRKMTRVVSELRDVIIECNAAERVTLVNIANN